MRGRKRAFERLELEAGPHEDRFASPYEQLIKRHGVVCAPNLLRTNLIKILLASGKISFKSRQTSHCVMCVYLRVSSKYSGATLCHRKK